MREFFVTEGVDEKKILDVVFKEESPTVVHYHKFGEPCILKCERYFMETPQQKAARIAGKVTE